MSKMIDKEQFVIVCNRHNDMVFGGNAILFWGPDSNGYTACLETAGLYGKEEALTIAKGTHGDDIPIPTSLLSLNNSDFKTTETGLKELAKITILNKHNEANKALLNECRKLYC